MKKIAFLLLIAARAGAHTQPMISPGIFYTKYIRKTENYTSAVIPFASAVFGSYYAEAKYSYDYDNTLGIYFGRTYSLSKDSSQSLVPQLGLLTGTFNGGSLQVYYQYQKKKIGINLQNQYSYGFQKRRNFYYNWSSVGYNVSKHFSAGLSAQLYLGLGGNYNDIGFFAAFKSKSASFFLFDFDSYQASRHYLAVALQTSVSLPKRKK